jgi:hypothetical protein
MASRKVSRKTSRGTTARKALLLQAAGAYGGTFRADGNMLVQVNPKTGRAYKGAYYLLREDLYRLLKDQVYDLQETLSVRHNKETGRATFGVLAPLDGSVIQIGCKAFNGKKAAALREWALSLGR